MVVAIFLGTFIVGFLALGVYLYFLRKGHMEDLEDVKYQMFFEDEDA